MEGCCLSAVWWAAGKKVNREEYITYSSEEQGQTEIYQDKLEPVSASHHLIPQW
jgi:hypothetical protein